MQLQQQQLQRQRMQLSGRQGTSSVINQRLRDDSQMGLRISSVSSLQNSSARKKAPNVNLPSSISISRVQPDDIRQRLPAGTSMMSSSNTSQPSSRRGGIRAMPKLKRGIRSGIGSHNQNSSSWQQQLMANPLRQNQIKALEEHGITDVNGIMGSVIPGLKRSSNHPGKGKNTKKRMRGGGAMSNSFLPSQKPARLCRVCCQTNVANFKLAERPDLIRALEFIIDLKIGMLFLTKIS